MLRRLIVILPLFWCVAAFGAEVTDSTGRVLQVPAEISRVLPAGPPAALLLAATFNAVVYRRALAPAQLDAVLGDVRSFQP